MKALPNRWGFLILGISDRFLEKNNPVKGWHSGFYVNLGIYTSVPECA